MSNPDPGRPRSLGAGEDLADAEAVLSTVAAARAVLNRRSARSGPTRVLRDAIWYLWEVPRFPSDVVPVHYPKCFPWSAAARKVWSASRGQVPRGDRGLRIEHLYPHKLPARDLLDPGLALDARSVLDVLSTRLMSAVITKYEHEMLPTERRTPKAWDSYHADPWIRYRDSGLDLASFAPLVGSPDVRPRG